MTEIDGFWSKFAFEGMTTRFAPFLHRDKTAENWSQSMGYYAHGYTYAFQRLVMVAIEMWPLAEYLRMPVFYLARHSAELQLKNVIKEYSTANGQPYTAADEHSLTKLWNKAAKQLELAGWPTDDDWSKYCGKLVQHLNEKDANGERFRYPEANDGTPFECTRVDLEELAKAHANVTLWCDAAIDMLHEAN